ncbi:hypothetical protein [Sagittula sp. S175]|uniref:hypothetical protein n=1 Tax=Sagittula sp. S175 TaxID=3415129 RepID=UPI003C7CBC4F
MSLRKILAVTAAVVSLSAGATFAGPPTTVGGGSVMPATNMVTVSITVIHFAGTSREFSRQIQVQMPAAVAQRFGNIVTNLPSYNRNLLISLN